MDIDVYPTEAPDHRRHSYRRGKVVAFSRKSRYNMFRTLAAVQLHRHSLPYWVSLTYHERCPAGRDQVRADIEAWRQRVRRRFPRAAYILKLEPQKRSYPHWHLILWSTAFDTEFESPETADWLAQQWHEVADPDSAYHEKHGARIRPITTYRGLVSYVSKYAAKVDDGTVWPFPGRRWSTGYHLQTRPLERIGATQRQLSRLKRAARLLMRLRGSSSRHLGHLTRHQSAVTLFLREGEADRLLAICGIDTLGESPAPPPGGA